MVESIACVEWIQRKAFDVGGSNTGSEGIGKHLKRLKEKAQKPRIYAMSKTYNDSGVEKTSKN